MTALVALTRNEFRLLRREPLYLFWGLVFPVILLVVLGSIPGFREVNADLGGVSLIAMGALIGEWSRFELSHVSMRSWLALGYLTVFGSLIAFSCYVWVFKVASTARASTYAFVNPVVAVFLGWALAGEEISKRTLVAATAIVLAVILIVRSSTSHQDAG